MTGGLAFFSKPAERVGYVPIEDYKIYYEIHGNGSRKLVLLTGFMASIGVWSGVVDHFVPKDCTCLVLSNRGFSRSTGGSAYRYTTRGLAEDVIKVLEYLDWIHPRSIHLIGTSFGGMIALELAYLQPELFRSMALLATAAQMSLPTLEHKLMPFRMLLPSKSDKVEAVLDTVFADYDWLNQPSEVEGFETNRDRLYYLVAREQQIDGKANLYTLIAQFLAVVTHNVQPDRLEELGKMIPHTLCIAGRRDKIIHYSLVEYLSLKLNSELVIFEKKGHGLPKEAHTEIVEQLERHFANANKSCS